jgi:hypothetical protein
MRESRIGVQLLDLAIVEYREALDERHRLDLVLSHVDHRGTQPLVQHQQLHEQNETRAAQTMHRHLEAASSRTADTSLTLPFGLRCARHCKSRRPAASGTTGGAE